MHIKIHIPLYKYEINSMKPKYFSTQTFSFQVLVFKKKTKQLRLIESHMYTPEA